MDQNYNQQLTPNPLDSHPPTGPAKEEPPFVARHKGLLIGVGIIMILGGIVLGLVRVLGGKSVSKVFSPPSSEENSVVMPELKVKVDPNDKDADGVKNDEEAKLGTSDFEFDSDGDGLSDSDETKIWKTDPSKMDTDTDGYNDGYEVLKGFNPNGQGKL